MRDFLDRRLKEIHLGHALVVLLLVAFGSVFLGQNFSIVSLLASSATTSLNSDPAVLYFTPYGESELLLGETTDIDVRINADVPINAIGTTILFSSDRIEIVGISKEKSFLDLWTEETTIREETGEIRFSGGTLAPGGTTGIETILTLTIRAKAEGPAELSFSEIQVLAADGKGSVVKSGSRSFAYSIIVPQEVVPLVGGGARATENYPPPAIDFNDDGKVSIVDLSILAMQLVGPYETKYDLDHSGDLGLRDLSIFFTRMKE